MLALAAAVFAGVVTLIGVLTDRGQAWWRPNQRESREVFDVGVHHEVLATTSDWVGNLTIPTVLRVITLLGAVLLWRRGRRAMAVWWVLTMVVGGAVAIGVRELIARPRPHWPGSGPLVDGYTFPSGHATSAALFAGTLVVVLWPYLGRGARVATSVAAVAFLVLVGVSRLILGVHSVGDVVAAWALAACLLLTALAVRRSEGGVLK